MRTNLHFDALNEALHAFVVTSCRVTPGQCFCGVHRRMGVLM